MSVVRATIVTVNARHPRHPKGVVVPQDEALTKIVETLAASMNG